MGSLKKAILYGSIWLISLLSMKRDSSNLTREMSWSDSLRQNEIVSNARNDLRNDGITSEQKDAYGFFSRRAYNTIIPVAYASNNFGSFSHLSSKFYRKDNTIEEKVINISVGDRFGDFLFNNKRDYFLGPAREDAFRMYLGMPQENNTFEISEHRPSKERGDVPYYYRLSREHEDEILKKGFETMVNDSIESFLISDERYTKDYVFDDVMGIFTITFGKDKKGYFLSYLDEWDLNPSIYGKEVKLEKVFGKPFEIYNKIYYDPVSKKRLD